MSKWCLFDNARAELTQAVRSIRVKRTGLCSAVVYILVSRRAHESMLQVSRGAQRLGHRLRRYKCR